MSEFFLYNFFQKNGLISMLLKLDVEKMLKICDVENKKQGLKPFDFKPCNSINIQKMSILCGFSNYFIAL